MKRYIELFIFLLLLCSGAAARDKKPRETIVAQALDTMSYSDEFLDTVNVKKAMTINDYTLLGVHYGVGLNEMSWTPSMEQKMLFTPVNVGVSWTRYGKMFGYMPYFGIQIGALYTKEGYRLEEGYKVQGASTAIMQIIEMPVLAHMHYDFWKMKLMVNIGFYGAYRLSIQRIGDAVRDEYEYNFTDTDYRGVLVSASSLTRLKYISTPGTNTASDRSTNPTTTASITTGMPRLRILSSPSVCISRLRNASGRQITSSRKKQRHCSIQSSFRNLQK